MPRPLAHSQRPGPGLCYLLEEMQSMLLGFFFFSVWVSPLPLATAQISIALGSDSELKVQVIVSAVVDYFSSRLGFHSTAISLILLMLREARENPAVLSILHKSDYLLSLKVQKK